MRDNIRALAPLLIIAGGLIFLALCSASVGCGLPTLDGPYCETVELLDWEPAYSGAEMDSFPMWMFDAELETYLWSYSGGGPGGWPDGNDFDEDTGVALSPKAKHLTTIEFLVTTYPDWEAFDPSVPLDTLEGNPLKWFAAMVYRQTPRTWFGCGDPGGGIAAIHYSRPKGDAVIYYPGYLAGAKVGRAAIIVHEVWHGTGARHYPETTSVQDRSIEDRSAYWMDIVFLASVCYAPHDYNITTLERNRACQQADWGLANRFVEPSGLTISDLADVWTDFRRYL